MPESPIDPREWPSIVLPLVKTTGELRPALLMGSKFVVDYLAIAAGTLPAKELSLDQREVFMGYMVRTAKIYGVYDLLIRNDVAEMAEIWWRVIIDNGICFEYLLENPTVEIATSYIKHSLAHEKKRVDAIGSRISPTADRDANRLQTQFQERCNKFGIQPETLDQQDYRWKTEQIANKLGNKERYDLAFRISSESLHGILRDLESNHLCREGSMVYPRVECRKADPLYLYSTPRYYLHLATSYVKFACGERHPLLPRLDALANWFELTTDSVSTLVNGSSLSSTGDANQTVN